MITPAAAPALEYSNVHVALMRWGAWRAYEYTAMGQRRLTRSFTSPDYDSFKKTCTTCHGKGTVRVVTGDGLEPTKCPKCKGSGGYMERYPVIDPATIPGRSVMNVPRDLPEVFRLIDDAVESFDAIRRAVVLTRYVYAAKEKKTKRLYYTNRILVENGEKPITTPVYGRVITDCKRRLAEITGLPVFDGEEIKS